MLIERQAYGSGFVMTPAQPQRRPGDFGQPLKTLVVAQRARASEFARPPHVVINLFTEAGDAFLIGCGQGLEAADMADVEGFARLRIGYARIVALASQRSMVTRSP